LHKRKKNFDIDVLNIQRAKTIELIKNLEDYMGEPVLIKDISTDMLINSIGRAIEDIPGGSYGRIKIFKSFIELLQNIDSKGNDAKKNS